MKKRRAMSVFRKAATFIQQIAGLGTDREMNYLQQREIKAINMLALGCALLQSGYAIVNLLQAPAIGVINILSVLCLLIVLEFNRRKDYQKAQYCFLAIYALFLGTTNIIYPNSTEHFLVGVAIISMLLIKNNYMLIFSTLFILLCIVIPQYFPTQELIVSQPEKHRLVFNTILGLFCTLAVIAYLKAVRANYHVQLNEQKSKLAQTNQNLQKLFAVISHDLRSPLIGAKQITEAIKANGIPSEQIENIMHSLDRQMGQILDTADGLLTWSKNNMQKMTPTPQSLDLGMAIYRIQQELLTQCALKKLDIEPLLPPKIHLLVDPQHLEIILRNLLGNAIKFSHPGSTIKITADKDEEMTNIYITDFGIGIPQHILETLLLSIQEPAWGTAGERGSGIGLSLVKELVDVNNGKITAKSQLGKYTTFTVSLPHAGFNTSN